MPLDLGADIWSGSVEGVGLGGGEAEDISHCCSSLEQGSHDKYCILQSSVESCEAFTINTFRPQS